MGLTTQSAYERIFGKSRPSAERGTVYRERPPVRRNSHLATPRIGGSDTMQPTQSMVDGKMFDSKSQYQAHLKENDCHVIEAGEPVTPVSQHQEVTAKDVRDAVHKTHADLGLGAM
ncbi:MAG: hypothetical protein AB8B85_10705 [Paracoccaceae bacterium]